MKTYPYLEVEYILTKSLKKYPKDKINIQKTLVFLNAKKAPSVTSNSEFCQKHDDTLQKSIFARLYDPISVRDKF